MGGNQNPCHDNSVNVKYHIVQNLSSLRREYLMFLIINICLYHKQSLSSFLRILPFLTAKTVMKWDEVCKMIRSLQKCTGLKSCKLFSWKIPTYFLYLLIMLHQLSKLWWFLKFFEIATQWKNFPNADKNVCKGSKTCIITIISQIKIIYRW